MPTHFPSVRTMRAIFLVLGTVALFIPIGCMVNIADTPIHAINSGDFSGENNGVKLLASPYADKDTILKYFGDNLLQYGILPIFIEVHNNSGNTILLNARAFSMSTMKTDTKKRESSAAVDARLLAARQHATFAEDLGAIVLGPILGALVKPGPVTQYQRNMNAVQINVKKKALKEQTLFANDSASGFIYLTFAENQGIATLRALTMDIVTTRGEKFGQIDVPMLINEQADTPPSGQNRLDGQP